MRWKTIALALALAAGAASAEELGQKVDPWVLDTASRGETEFLVLLREQADLRGARSLAGKEEKGAFVLDALSTTAERSQKELLALLESRGVAHRSYWVANMIWVRGGRGLVEELAAREDVFHIYANPKVHFEGPVGRQPLEGPSPETIEWNITKVHAPDVWNLGFTGQGAVVAGADSGYQWDHPALKLAYRGWSGASADHNYNWHDAIHSGGGVCGHDSPAPCDDTIHGTHTMGTMVGDDGGSNQIGMAPGAKWIGCRNMDQGDGTPATYTECFQWFIAPTDLQNQNPDATKAPHVINNSWACPPSEGCTEPTILQAVVESARAAGIEVVASAGNDGLFGCGTINAPPAIYDASFTVGATDSVDVIAYFSSRGPVTVDGSNRLKPDVCAPGVGIRSSIPGGSYTSLNGTSFAGPHVAGLVALLLSANPGIIGQPDSIEPLITSSALARTTSQTCGGVPGDAIPNNTYGWGRVDALAAVNAAAADLSVAQSDSPDPALPGVPVTYSVTIGNAGPAAANSVAFADTLSLIAIIDSATPSKGTCTILTHAVTCDLGSIASSGQATIQIVITPSATGTITSAASVTGNQWDPNTANDAFSEQTAVVDCPFPAPAITAPVSVESSTDGLMASASSGAGHTDTWTLTGGVITSGQGTSQITFQSGAPGTTMTLQVVDSLAGCDVSAANRLVSADFLDVPPSNLFHDDVNTVARNGVTAGCGGGNYCPAASVNRAQMAVFLLKSKFGASHVPPPATGTVFTDVPIGSFAADWIEELASLGVTGGCGGGTYCPGAPVTRAQMAVFLLKTLLGSGYTPPPATGIFGDVPVGSFADAWIEDLYARGITGGCQASPLLYCPANPNTRGQMAVFLTRTFGLQ